MQPITGGDALDWLRAVAFDLIVLDVLLPGLDGLAVCREARRIGVQHSHPDADRATTRSTIAWPAWMRGPTTTW